MTDKVETVYVWASSESCLRLKDKFITKGQEVDLKLLSDERAKRLVKAGDIKEELKKAIPKTIAKPDKATK